MMLYSDGQNRVLRKEGRKARCFGLTGDRRVKKKKKEEEEEGTTGPDSASHQPSHSHRHSSSVSSGGQPGRRECRAWLSKQSIPPIPPLRAQG